MGIGKGIHLFIHLDEFIREVFSKTNIQTET